MIAPTFSWRITNIYLCSGMIAPTYITNGPCTFNHVFVIVLPIDRILAYDRILNDLALVGVVGWRVLTELN
jgi:hypothetical protein